MKKIVIFGGAGYLGSTLTNLLLKESYQVRVVDNFHKGTCDTLIPFIPNDNFEFMFGDVTNPEDVKRGLDGAAAVVNMASIVGFPACSRNPALSELVNIGGAENIMKYKPAEMPLIFTSTGSVYGALGELCTELSPANPPTIYGKTKLEAEKIFLAGENTIVHRYATAFGVGFNSTRVNLLVNTLVYEAMINKIITVFEADFKRTFIHCRDICSAINFTLKNWYNFKHRVYNVGNGNLNISKRWLANFIGEKTGCLVQFAETGKDFDVRNYEVDYSRIENEGWKAQIGMEQGIKEIIKITPMLTQWNRYN